MDEVKGKFQFAGLSWLYQMELIDDPQLINNLKLNIFDASPHVREVEFVSSHFHRSMLVWIELSWLGRFDFVRSRAVSSVEERIKQLLPNFRIRVVTDRSIFDLALDKVSKAMERKKEEATDVKTTVANVVKPDSSAVASSSELQQKSDLLQHQDPESES